MSLPSASVARPVFTTMTTLIVVVLGVFALMRIPLDLMPELTMPVITVRTTYDNASPSDVEEQITKPLERVLAAVPGAKNISSTSMEASSSVFIEFEWGINLDEATNDVRDRIDRVINRLPEEIDRPVIQKFDTASRPIMFLGVDSNLHPVDLKRFIDDEVSYRLERSTGVASASGFGGLDREILVELDQSKVKALGLDLPSLVDLIRNENLTEAGGEIDRGRLSVAVRTRGEFASVDELGSIMVARNQGGTPVRLRDVADVRDGWARVTRVTRVNGRDGQFMGVFKQSGANTVEAAESASKAILEINSTLANVKVTPLFDSASYIKTSISTVTETAVYGGLLAVLVILLFLQHVPSTLVLALSIPTSIVATFMAMYFFGLTLNVITLGALALGVGMLVDNSIVVLDNVFRLRSEGRPAPEAAAAGADEVAGAIVASTLTTLSVFLPLIFLDGLAGAMFRPFSVTIAFALASSLLVSLTLAPMLSSRMLADSPRKAVGPAAEPGAGPESGRRVRRFGEPRYGRKLFKLVEVVYLKWLQRALARPWWTIALSLAALGLSALLIPAIGSEFLPRTDESAFRINLTLAPGTRVEQTSETLKLIEEVVAREVPETVATSADIGGSGGYGGRASHTAELMVKLLPVKERERSVFEILDVLRPQLDRLPGATVRLRAQQSFLVGGGGGDRIQIELRGNDLVRSAALTEAMKMIVEGVPSVSDVYSSNEDATLEEIIVVDRDRAADAMISVASVSKLIKTAVGGSTAGYYRENGKEYPITVKLRDSASANIDELMQLPVASSQGRKSVLANVARVHPAAGPLKITRKNQARIVTVYADITDRSLGEVVADIDRELKKLPLGADFSYSFSGEAEEQAKTFRGLTKVLILAVFLVYMVMACQFEQLKGPLVVMCSVPFGAIGVLWSHFLTGTAFNFNSFIGVIMLAGVLVNNAIILVDHANLLRRRDRLPLTPALMETGRRRLRPILMTSLTTILGLIPVALGWGEGGESQAPLGRAVIGGLTASTFITLFLVPSVYKLFFAKDELRQTARQGETTPAADSPALADAASSQAVGLRREG
ncbi:MAG: efflux RND transporter permease subunit [Deltaproteobacteria bacterium]|jgi:HAE1 family hydrophobic/amphiphilic exporter-1|nr:efflux RND transporter permease subunit [Deltaproteobacteria bacterium]